jgi:hypothetical protein
MRPGHLDNVQVTPQKPEEGRKTNSLIYKENKQTLRCYIRGFFAEWHGHCPGVQVCLAPCLMILKGALR